MFRIFLRNIQHISTLEFSLDLKQFGLLAIVGKNGVGKTTLARAIRNLSLADTFTTTAGADIFSPDSEIIYEIEDTSRTFRFDAKIGSLNCKQSLPSSWRTDFAVELSIPTGERFNFFKSLSESDHDIRASLALDEFSTPTELISLLQAIYPEKSFENLAEVKVRKNSYFCVRKPDRRYIREDYLSSGEYFLINLYKRIRLGKKLIFVDEIDISLDASAQVRLLVQLRKLCTAYNSNVIFTTHSLAMIRMLHPGELQYFSQNNGEASITPSSFGYVNSLLYGFRGWDRYILTEDDVLKGFLEYVIQRYCLGVFQTFLVIHVGGSGNVTKMLDQNAREQFLAPPEHVIAVLDGDQENYRVARHERTHCVPIQSVEKALVQEYCNADFPHRLDVDKVEKNLEPKNFDPKKLFKDLVERQKLTKGQIYELLCDRHDEAVYRFSGILVDLLGSDTVRAINT